MNENRIFFKGNPWPEGHLIEEFKWLAEIRNGDVYFLFHLVSSDYYSERDILNDESWDDAENEHLSDWEHPASWCNYHHCTLSANHWHTGGFKVCSLDQYNIDMLDNRSFLVDPPPIDWDDDDARAFAIYLLGHDSAIDHTIKFRRISGTDFFDISWAGKIALTYVGEYEPKYEFQAHISQVPAPILSK